MTLLAVPVRRTLWTDYLLAVHDGESVTATRQIRGAWLDSTEEGFRPDFRFLDAPVLFEQDVDGDNRPELLIKDRQHNGTWNAAYLHIYRATTSALDYRGSFEYILHLSTSNQFLKRVWDYAAGRVEVFLADQARGAGGRPVGSFRITVGDTAITCSDVTVLDERYRDLILPAEETLRQRDGWNWQYQ